MNKMLQSRSLSALTVMCAATLLCGCLSQEVVHKAEVVTDKSEAEVAKVMAAQHKKTQDELEAEQVVDLPYLVGDSVPLAREVTLPKALQDDYVAAVLFPDHLVTLETAAERLSAAIRIPITISPDVYLDASALLPKSMTAATLDKGERAGAAQGQAAGAANGNGAPSAPLPADMKPGMSGGDVGTGYGVNKRDCPTCLVMDSTKGEPASLILDRIVIKIGCHWYYDPKENVVKIGRLAHHVWSTPFGSFATKFSSNFDSGTSTAQTNNANALSSKPFASPVSTDSKDNFGELLALRDSLSAVMTRAGNVTINAADGDLVMTDTQEAIDAADVIVRNQVRILSRSVTLHLVTMQFSGNNSTEAAANITAALAKAFKRVPDMTFSVGSPQSLADSNTGSIGFNVLSGSANGTSVFFNSLKEIAKSETTTNVPLNTKNRHPVSYYVTSMFSYVSATTPAAATTGGTGGTPGLTTSQDTVGMKLFMFPILNGNGTGSLIFTLDQSVLQNIQTFSIGQGATQQSVQLPNKTGEGNPGSQEVLIRNNEIVLLSGFDRSVDQYDRRTMGDNVPMAAGGSGTGSNTKTVTLVMLWPEIHDEPVNMASR